MESLLVTNRQIHGAGTTEEEWRQCAELQKLVRADLWSLLSSTTRLIICAPHPDDEILPCGGLLVEAAAAGTTIHVIAVTDGEASHGDDPVQAGTLRRRRPLETIAALRELRVDARIERLEIPDGKVAAFASHLFGAFRFRPADIVVTPWRWDGHPDHEATTRAVLAASAEIGFEVLETPIWGWHWSKPSDRDFPWHTGVRFPLTYRAQALKRRAIREFHSQLTGEGNRLPILTPATLARFERSYEVYFR